MNSEGNDASRSWKLGEGGHDSYWQRAWLDAQTKYKKSKKGISCDEKRKDAESQREGGEKKSTQGASGGDRCTDFAGGGCERARRERRQVLEVEQILSGRVWNVCIVVQDASDVLATVVCIVFRISGRVGMYAVRERWASEYVKGTRAPWRVRATHAMCTIRTRLCTEQVPCATVRSPLLSASRARRCQISCGSCLRLAWGEKRVEGEGAILSTAVS